MMRFTSDIEVKHNTGIVLGIIQCPKLYLARYSTRILIYTGFS